MRHVAPGGKITKHGQETTSQAHGCLFGPTCSKAASNANTATEGGCRKETSRDRRHRRQTEGRVEWNKNRQAQQRNSPPQLRTRAGLQDIYMYAHLLLLLEQLALSLKLLLLVTQMRSVGTRTTAPASGSMCTRAASFMLWDGHEGDVINGPIKVPEKVCGECRVVVAFAGPSRVVQRDTTVVTTFHENNRNTSVLRRRHCCGAVEGVPLPCRGVMTQSPAWHRNINTAQRSACSGSGSGSGDRSTTAITYLACQHSQLDPSAAILPNGCSYREKSSNLH